MGRWSGGVVLQWTGIVVVGAAVGYLGGMFGKGGSAIATPLLAALGVPAIVAVASPLPATVPGTLVAYRRYRSTGITDPSVTRWSIVLGVPATILGALATRWVDADALVMATEVAVMTIGLRVLMRADRPEVVPPDVEHRRARLVVVALTVGFLAGLLANSGGFLLVPLYLAVVKLPIKTALSSSLLVASVLALPGTVVHAALGHIDWAVTATFAVASVPLSSLGARTAIRMDAARLERVYGAGLALLGAVLLVARAA